MKTFLLAASLLALAACAGGREIRHVSGCDDRLENPEKRVACRACIERPEPHLFFPDRPEGERCVRQ